MDAHLAYWWRRYETETQLTWKSFRRLCRRRSLERIKSKESILIMRLRQCCHGSVIADFLQRTSTVNSPSRATGQNGSLFNRVANNVARAYYANSRTAYTLHMGAARAHPLLRRRAHYTWGLPAREPLLVFRHPRVHPPTQTMLPTPRALRRRGSIYPRAHQQRPRLSHHE